MKVQRLLASWGCVGLLAAGGLTGCGGEGISPDPASIDMASPDLVTIREGEDMAGSGTGDLRSVSKGLILGFPSDFVFGTNLYTPRLADLNNDGKLDVVVIDSVIPDGTGNIGATLTVGLGNGDGTFMKLSGIVSPNSLGDLRIADFNGDHKPDLVVTDVDVPANGVGAASFDTGSNVEIFLGHGDGTFASPVPYLVLTEGGPYSVVTGDFNNDGHIDIATADFGTSGDTDRLSVLLNKGDGTFGAATHYTINFETEHVATADFNGDGKLDLISSSPSSTQMTIFYGAGDGTFSPKTIPIPPTTASLLAAADINGDGKADIIETDTNGLEVFLNGGGGTFSTPSSSLGNAFGDALSIGDLTGDGLPELVLVTSPGINIYVNEDGVYDTAPKPAAISNPATGSALGDLNGDGAVDLVVTDGANLTVILHG